MSDLALTHSPAIALENARAAFFARLDVFCAAGAVSPSRVSRELFGSTRRVAELRAGADIGVLRLAEAERDLAAWAEREGISLSLDGGETR